MFRHAWEAQRFVEGVYDTDSLRRVEELLIAWGEAESSYRGVLGYSPQAAGGRLAQSGMQYMTTTEVLGERDRGRVVDEVEACVEVLPDPYAAILRAIYANTAGRAVWERGAFAGMGRERVKRLCREAVVMLLPKLRRRGLGIE